MLFLIFFFKWIRTGRLMNQPVSFYHQSIYLTKCIRKTYSLSGSAMNRDEPRITATNRDNFLRLHNGTELLNNDQLHGAARASSKSENFR